MTLSQGETRALLVCAALVLLAAVGRTFLTPAGPQVVDEGLASLTEVDAALAVAESLRAEEERRRRPLAPGERIDPNRADEIELDRLPGVGPALARAIVANRRSHGPYRSLRDLERVPGLGSSIVGRLAPHTPLPPIVVGDGGPSVDEGGARPPGLSGSRVEKVDVNRATVKELQALPGIGPARASAIVRWRSEHGSFRTLDDLLDVAGIGPATLERIRALARVGP